MNDWLERRRKELDIKKNNLLRKVSPIRGTNLSKIISNSSEEMDQIITEMIQNKFKLVYSERLGRKVFTLQEWVDKPVFKRHRKLFGFTDVGWTVKHPKQLIRVLIREGIWKSEKFQ